MSQTNQPDLSARGQWVCGECLDKWPHDVEVMTLGRIGPFDCFVCGNRRDTKEYTPNYIATATAIQIKKALNK